jgi:hypothetical protein
MFHWLKGGFYFWEIVGRQIVSKLSQNWVLEVFKELTKVFFISSLKVNIIFLLIATL